MSIYFGCIIKTYLFKILQRLILPPHDSCHTAESGLLQLLASVEAVAKLQKSDIVLGHIVDQMSGGVDLTERKFVMILKYNNNKIFQKKSNDAINEQC